MRFVYKILIVVALVLPLMGLIKPGYFSMHDDLQVMRLYEMQQCMQDGQIPCRWVPDMGAGYGFPLFNYYAPLPYYIGAVLGLFGISFITIVKILFGIALILPFYFTYLLAREFTGKTASIIAGIFFVYAPYHAVQIFVRGALSEAWATMFAPLILWSLYKFIKERKVKYFVASIVSICALVLSHNIFTMVFLPVSLVWVIIWIAKEKDKKIFLWTMSIYVWAISLSAFFILPAFFEKGLVSVDSLTSDYYNYQYHFANLKQLFVERIWGYGPSKPGFDDNISFQLGMINWMIVILSVPLALYRYSKKSKKVIIFCLFGVLLFFAAAFMVHSKSFIIWDFVPYLSFVQFPWRFLTLTIIGSSIAASVFTQSFGRYKVYVAITLLFANVVLNITFLNFSEYYPDMTDEKKLSGQEWEQQSKAAINDYLPIAVNNAPQNISDKMPVLISGQATVSKLDIKSSRWHFDAEVHGGETANIKVPIFDFANWEVVDNGVLTDHSAGKEDGLITVNLAPGKHIVVGWFKNTRLREFSNLITFAAFVSIMLFIGLKKWDNQII